MSNKTWYIIWGVLYALCAGMGFIPSPEGLQYWALVALAVFFFLPGAVLLRRAVGAGDAKTCRLIWILSLCSLVGTMVMVIVNFLSFNASEAAGIAMHILLVVISVPMVCGQIWALSLFLWACLLMVSRKKAK